jgi:spore maturation protein CgeB
MKLVVLGLSITSSWGNGHATTYRGLLREMTRRGHEVLFLERDVPWYAAHRDMPNPVFCATRLYPDLATLQRLYASAVAEADAVILGSYVPDGAEVGAWVCRTARGVKAFYDIDTPVTLAKLGRGEHEYLTPELIPCFDLYLSFTGGPTLDRLEEEFGARAARSLFCSVDERLYRPVRTPVHWDLGYLGTYSDDRQAKLDALLLGPARELHQRRFAVAGPLYPDAIIWPANVSRLEHLPPPRHPAFYAAQRFTLNVTRADMIAAGWSPSVRLFEAASCGVPIISDPWPGLDELFRPGVEILLAESGSDVARLLTDLPDTRRRSIAAAARRRVLATHSSAARAAELDRYLLKAVQLRPSQRRAAG